MSEPLRVLILEDLEDDEESEREDFPVEIVMLLITIMIFAGAFIMYDRIPKKGEK